MERPRSLLAVCFVVLESELDQVRGGPVSLEVDSALGAVVRDECVAVELGQRGREHWAHKLPESGPHAGIPSG